MFLNCITLKEQLIKAISLRDVTQSSLVEATALTDIQLLKAGDNKAFERIFKQYFKSLHSYALMFLKDEALAEEAVQNVFVRIWEKKDQLNVLGSLKAYLYRAVHNESLNYLKHQKVRADYQLHYSNTMEEAQEQTEGKVIASELEKQILSALNDLPQQCRLIFQMSRFEQLKYQEIADQLGLSIKTVENQMGKALKIMRLKLTEFLPLILLILFDLFNRKR